MRKKIFLKKIASSLALAGLMTACLPIQLFAQEAPLLTSWQTKKPTAQEIEVAIEKINKATKTTKVIKTFAIAAATGVGIAGIGLTALFAVLGTIAIISTGGAATGAVTFTVAGGTGLLGGVVGAGTTASSAGTSILGIVIAGIIMAAATGGFSGIPILGGILTTPAKNLLHSFDLAQNFKQIKAKYPGILSGRQEKILTDFNKEIRGSITKGIVTATATKKALQNYTNKILTQYPNFVTQFGGQKKATKTIKKFLEANRLLKNIYPLFTEHIKKINDQTKKRNDLPIFTPARSIADIKLVKLKFDLKYLTLKSKRKKQLKRFKKLSVNDREMINNLTQQYVQRVETIISTLNTKIK